MSIEAMSVVLHHSKAQGASKLVLLGIANHQGDGGAWPSIATLSKYAGGIDRRIVQRALRELTKAGELSCEIQAGGSYGTEQNGRPNRYWVLLTCPPECDGSTNHRKKVGDDADTAGGRHPDRPGGGVHAAGGAAPTPPKPSLEPLENQNLVQSKNELQEKFEKFWSIYPRKQGKGKAADSFIKAYSEAGEDVLDGALRYANDPNLPTDKQFIPLPATWLNQERWNDEPLPYREPTAEEIAARARADAERKRQASLEESARVLAESKRAREQALANPPRRCEHDRVLVMCRICSKT